MVFLKIQIRREDQIPKIHLTHIFSQIAGWIKNVNQDTMKQMIPPWDDVKK